MNWDGLLHRVTDYSQIQKWWEIVMSAYLMVSFHAPVLNNTLDQAANESLDPIVQKFQQHDWWDKNQGWKNLQGQFTPPHSTFYLL